MSIYESYVTLLNINDGAPGQPGAPGRDAQSYIIDTNQEEIMKFFVNDKNSLSELNLLFSPEDFIISIYENNSEKPEGREKINIDYPSEDFHFYFYEQTDKDWIEFSIPENYYSIEQGSLILYFNLLRTYGESEKRADESDQDYEDRISSSAFTFIRSAIEENLPFKIEYKINIGNKNYIAEKIINIRNAMTQDMAKLSVEADKIFSSIANSSLEFSANGLTIRNGGFKIFNKELEEVLKADINGNLIIKGKIYATDGRFNGEIYASNGEFNGIIKANGGSIGGFDITDQYLSSKAKKDNNIDSLIVLNGTTGEIIAENIQLGSGANIKEYIKLGDFVKIWNPQSSENRNFIEILGENSQNIVSLNERGIFTFGDITNSYIQIDGSNQEIFAMAPNKTNYSWLINPQEAIFNNIAAQGSIKAASFEYGAVQAIGGTLLIRPSSRIKEINGFEITLENTESGFYVNDLCVIELSQNNLKKYYIKSIEKNIITLKDSAGELVEIDNMYIGSPIINLGSEKAVGIGINGSGRDSYGISSNTISIVEHDGLGNLNSKIILGKLPNNSESFGQAAGTYGLYAENVVLNGSLTTKTATQSTSTYNNDFSYSGMGTTLGYSGAPTAENMTERFPNSNRGQILFWAGAKGSSKQEVEASKFFIDQYGNMYAGSGYFEGTIITKSTIEAAEIKTAILTGTGYNNEGNPALIIKDVSEGIHFYNKNSNANPVFRLSDQEFVINDLKVSLNKNFIVTKEGGLELSRIELKDGIVINGTTINYPRAGSEIKFGDNSDIILKPDTGEEMVVSSQGVSMNGNVFYMNGKNIKGEYRQIKGTNEQVIGYDLYIY